MRKSNVNPPVAKTGKGATKAKSGIQWGHWLSVPRVRWLLLCAAPIVAFLLFNSPLHEMWLESSGRREAMPETAVVDSGREPGFLSRIFRIQIDYDDRLDERAKLELSRGKKLMQNGRYLEALPYFDEVLATFPRNGDALFFRAQTLYRIGMFERAADDVDQVLRRYPDDIESLALHAELMSELGRLEEARASVRRVEQSKPEARYVRRMLARGFRRIGEVDKAHELLTKLLNEQPRDAESSYEMAMLLATAVNTPHHNPAEALQFARRALREEPENWTFAQAAALALASGGRFDEAVRIQKHVVDSAPKWAWRECAEQLEAYRRDQFPAEDATSGKTSTRPVSTQPASSSATPSTTNSPADSAHSSSAAPSVDAAG